MKKTDWKEAAELVGIAAIVASLIFVGMEMRQTRELAMASAYQDRAELEMSLMLSYVAPETVNRAIVKIQNGEALSDEEQNQHFGLMQATFTYFENSHYQWQSGLLDERFWDAQLASMRAVLGNQVYREYWEQWRLSWREPFREIVDSLMAEADPEVVE